MINFNDEEQVKATIEEACRRYNLAPMRMRFGAPDLLRLLSSTSSAIRTGSPRTGGW